MQRARESGMRINRFISLRPIFPQPERTQAAQQQKAAEIKRHVQERCQRECTPGKGETRRETREMEVRPERPEEIRPHGRPSIAAGSSQIDDFDAVHSVSFEKE